MKTAATNKKVRELIKMVQDGTLIPRPEFQRRLVWSREDKNGFIDTILKGFPFPEIYFGDGEIDTTTGDGTTLLVDGQQRVNTIIQYFTNSEELKLTTVPKYSSLDEEQKKDFLQYDVPVRDLGNIDRELIIEIFRRINSTKYSLKDIEINNALYAGKYKQFSETVLEKPYFIENSIFNAQDYKRMGDLRFVLTVVSTMINGYFNRDIELEPLLNLYNDDFDLENEISIRIDKVIDFFNECNFDKKSRIWKKADLFTSFIELDQIINIQNIDLNPSEMIDLLESFYSTIDNQSFKENSIESIYYKAALQASNDKKNRILRGMIIEGILLKKPSTEILKKITP